MWYILVVWAVELEFYVLKTHTTPYLLPLQCTHPSLNILLPLNTSHLTTWYQCLYALL